MSHKKKKKKKNSKKKKKNLPLFYATFQCGRYDIFKKKFKKKFDPEKVKKRASKVAHNRPRPFYFTVQPRPKAHSPELIFHIMKSRDQTSVLLSVFETPCRSFEKLLSLFCVRFSGQRKSEIIERIISKKNSSLGPLSKILTVKSLIAET